MPGPTIVTTSDIKTLIEAFIEEAAPETRADRRKKLYYFLNAFLGKDIEYKKQVSEYHWANLINEQALSPLWEFLFLHASDQDVIGAETKKKTKDFKKGLKKQWAQKIRFKSKGDRVERDTKRQSRFKKIQYYKKNIAERTYERELSTLALKEEFKQLLQEEASSPLFRLRTMLSCFNVLDEKVKCCHAALSGGSGAGKSYVSSLANIWEKVKEGGKTCEYSCSFAIDGGKEREESHVRQALIQALKETFGARAMFHLDKDIPAPQHKKKFKKELYKFWCEHLFPSEEEKKNRRPAIALFLPVAFSGAKQIKEMRQNCPESQFVDLYIHSAQGLAQGHLRSLNEGKKQGGTMAQNRSTQMEKKADFKVDNDTVLLLVKKQRVRGQKQARYCLRKYDYKSVELEKLQDLNSPLTVLRVKPFFWEKIKENPLFSSLYFHSADEAKKSFETLKTEKEKTLTKEEKTLLNSLQLIPMKKPGPEGRHRADSASSDEIFDSSLFQGSSSEEESSYQQSSEDESPDLDDGANANDSRKGQITIRGKQVTSSEDKQSEASGGGDRIEYLDIIQENLEKKGFHVEKVFVMSSQEKEQLEITYGGKEGSIALGKNTAQSFSLTIRENFMKESVEAVSESFGNAYVLEAEVTLGSEFTSLMSEELSAINLQPKIVSSINETLKGIIALQDRGVTITNSTEIKQSLETIREKIARDEKRHSYESSDSQGQDFAQKQEMQHLLQQACCPRTLTFSRQRGSSTASSSGPRLKA